MIHRSLYVLLFFGAAAMAAPPVIDAILPAGGKIGREVEITLVGKCDPWPCEFWASDSGVSFQADEKKKLSGKLTLKSSVKPGPVWIRFVNAEGASEPRIFYAGEMPEILEDEKANHGAVLSASKIEAPLPLVVNGRLLNRNEADFYSVSLKKGQVLHVGLDGYALRSPVDPMLHIYDSDGGRLELEHDGPTNLDPRLAFAVPQDGDFIIGVSGISHPASANVNFQGSTSTVYRLYLSVEPKILPPHLLAPKLSEIPPKPGVQTAPVEVVSMLKNRGTPHRITVSGKKGETLLAKVEAFTLGFETDPVLRIFKPDGALLRETDDVKPTRDSEYLWKVSADGEYGVEVADRFGRAGEEMGYRLTVAPPEPDYSATADKHSYVVKAGESSDIKISIKRLHGHKEPLTLSLAGIEKAKIEVELPDEIPEKSGDVVIKLTAGEDVKAFNGPIQIHLRETESEKDGKIVPFSLQDSAARGPFLLDEIQDLWLTLLSKPKAAPEKKAENPKE